MATSTTMTNDHGLTFCCNLGSVGNLSAANNPLNDPFPVRADGTRFTTPYGNSLGEIIRQGRGWTIKPRDYSPAWQQRWRVGVSRQLRRDMVVEVSYNGAYSKIPLDHTLSPVPQQYWSTGNTRNQAVEDYLNTFVSNPFNVSNFTSLQTSNPKVWNYLNTQSYFTATTLRRYQLIRAYPGMNGLNRTDPRGGTNKYHDLEVSFEKRMSKGLHTAVLYTRAYDMVRDYIPNEYDPTPQWRPGADVRPHRFVWQMIWELPFGKGRTWLTQGPLQHVLGGWMLSWIYQYQNGPATGWNDRRYFYGDPKQLGALFNHDAVHSKDIHMWFDPSIAYKGTGPIPAGFTGFEGRSSMQAAGWQVATFANRLDVLREDGIRNWDVKIQRSFRMYERLNTRASVDLLNATNHTNFAGPNTDPTSTNFGRVDTQRGLSRVIQFNLRFDF
jgi:hypothetical protein